MGQPTTQLKRDIWGQHLAHHKRSINEVRRVDGGSGDFVIQANLDFHSRTETHENTMDYPKVRNACTCGTTFGSTTVHAAVSNVVSSFLKVHLV